MQKNVLIISASLRQNSNSEKLAQAFAQGAKDAGNEVLTVSLKGKNVAFCRGCMACQKLGKCVMNDDANTLADLICSSDVVVWTTPIYYYEMSGQMKTLIDRANSLYARDYRFRDVYLLSCAADDAGGADAGAVKGVQGWIDCFENARFAGKVFAGGVDAPGSIERHPALTEAYEMGKNIR